MSDDEVDEDGVSDVEEPELVESEREPAPEPAPEPMLPEVVSRGLEEVDEDDGERLPLDCELLLSDVAVPWLELLLGIDELL